MIHKSCQGMICFNFTVPSSPPRNVTVVTHNPASLNVSWQIPIPKDRNGLITGYMINYTRVGSNNTMSVVTNGTTHTISELSAFVNYSVIVAAMTVNGTGQFSDAVIGRSGKVGELDLLLCDV